MNPVLQEAARHAQYGWIAGVMTALFIAWFLACVWWAYAARNKNRFEEAAKLPFEGTTGDHDK